MTRVGDAVPGLESLASLLVDNRYEGVPVREEPPGPFGGGRYVRGRTNAEVRLERGMLARADVDALAILEHERGHAARDLPAPRLYRLGLVGAFLAALALALGRPDATETATTVMAVTFTIAALHALRDEAAASEHALRRLADRGLPLGIRRQAATRLGAAFGIYLADWGVGASLVTFLVGALGCR